MYTPQPANKQKYFHGGINNLPAEKEEQEEKFVIFDGYYYMIMLRTQNYVTEMFIREEARPTLPPKKREF